jgi:hypothetical protein
MTINVFELFSETTTGKPIVLNTEAPGVLIHHTNTEMDSIWLWANVASPIPYTKSVYIKLVKGTALGGYTEELIEVPPARKFLIENGLILTGNVDLLAYIDDTISTVDPLPEVLITGYVHRRI